MIFLLFNEAKEEMKLFFGHEGVILIEKKLFLNCSLRYFCLLSGFYRREHLAFMFPGRWEVLGLGVTM